MLVEAKTLTYEEYLAMPEMNCRYEIIDGVLLMSPTPIWKHNRTVRRIANLLEAFVMEKDLGEVQQAPYDVVVEEDPLRTRQPDVLFVSADKVRALGIETLDELAQLPFAPDLAVEVLSPGNTRGDIEEKLDDYARIGVRECWLVSPEAQTVEVLKLTRKGYRRIGLYGMGAKVKSDALPGLELPVADLFTRRAV